VKGYKKAAMERSVGQILLGEEGFVDKFKDHITDKEKIKEIPRTQRYVNRPPISKLLSADEKITQRNKHIYTAHVKYGYTLKEIADQLDIHYTTVSKIPSEIMHCHASRKDSICMKYIFFLFLR
jgi:DNA-binding NarL/FixJ family response regulator